MDPLFIDYSESSPYGAVAHIRAAGAQRRAVAAVYGESPAEAEKLAEEIIAALKRAPHVAPVEAERDAARRELEEARALFEQHNEHHRRELEHLEGIVQGIKPLAELAAQTTARLHKEIEDLKTALVEWHEGWQQARFALGFLGQRQYGVDPEALIRDALHHSETPDGFASRLLDRGPARWLEDGGKEGDSR